MASHLVLRTQNSKVSCLGTSPLSTPVNYPAKWQLFFRTTAYGIITALRVGFVFGPPWARSPKIPID
jgi:hypothetical protein